MQFKNSSSPVVVAGFIIALTAGFIALVSGPGTDRGLWNFRTGITMLRWAAYGGSAAALLSLLGLIASLRSGLMKSILLALLGIILGSSVAGLMLHWKHVAESVPRIHDITSDTEDPPEFAAVLRLRGKNENSPLYGGAETASLQRKAYPDIVPLMLSIPPDKAFDNALSAAKQMGWRIIDEDRSAGLIEAVAVTFWFGFKDDIVIRIRPVDTGSRLDIRSASRVGLSDLGKNAERIREFYKSIKEGQGPSPAGGGLK